MLCKIGNTPRYHFEPTNTQPDDFYLNNKHKLINGEIPYNGILGGKTGYTDNARQTLVTCAEQNGMRLVCIVFKEESPAQFTDTEELFNYGFHNFQVMNISENEDRYNIEATGFLQIGDDIFGSSKPILSIDTDSYVIVPNVVSFSDLDSEIDYSISDENQVAQIRYSYHDMYVGSAYLNLVTESGATYEFDTNITTSDVSVERVEPESDKEPGPGERYHLYQCEKGINHHFSAGRQSHFPVCPPRINSEQENSKAQEQSCQTQTAPQILCTFRF